ncbi:MAG: TonB-dependent receptor [Methylotenera sp.]|nr:TonB-dependent receptor [Methylotenera sp.]
MEKNLKLKIVASATIAALAHMSAAFAEEVVAADATTAAAPAQAEAVVDNTPLNLDKIVVTGSANKVSKMKSSVSISTMNAEQVTNTGATNAAEVLRSIPGVRSESSGGEGNANMTVRGLPISAGGSRYVQMQEDGLPILQFGDVAFATPDMFMRVDQSLNKLEVVRGGSGSTLATNSPGGIINFISNTGEVKGGKIGLSAGLNFNQWRTDLSYGAPLDDNGLRFFVSGFYRTGDGLRDAGVTMEQGGQIKGNITKQLDNGYIRASFKHLDDQTPVNMPVPVKITGGKISQLPGIDPRTATFYSKNWGPDVTLGGNNSQISSNVNDGMTVKTDSIGLEAAFDFGGWNVSDKFRWADNRGRFIGLFPTNDVAAGQVGITIFNTSLNDMGNTVNDFKLSKAFDAATAGKWTPTVGLYTSWQNVGATWNFNQYTVSANSVPTIISVDAQQAAVWGGCCNRDIDAEYRTISPYASLAWEMGNLNTDVSVRYDKQDASGSYAGVTGAVYGARNTINYSINHTSWSAGANYRINTNLAVFGRASNGVAFNADRIMFGNPLDGSAIIPVNEVDQYEAGVKWRQGNLNTFVTLFQAKTDESNYTFPGLLTNAYKYDAKGVELEFGYSINNFKLGGGLTYTDAEVVKSTNAAVVGFAPNRQAKVVYQISPSYAWDKFTIGGSVIGTTKSTDNRGAGALEATLPAYALVNSFLRYQYDSKLQLTLSANNLFDSIAYTESNDGRMAARAADGRSVKASVVYSF